MPGGDVGRTAISQTELLCRREMTRFRLHTVLTVNQTGSMGCSEFQKSLNEKVPNVTYGMR